jgi:hypothetical protein
MKIVGTTIAKGEYEGNQYHNVVFHCTEPIDADRGTGFKVKTVKTKYRVLAEVIGKPPTDKDIAAMVGKEATFFYDEYKNVAAILGLA